ncbi:MAG: FAD-binding protein, partial [Pseudomonadota bacterium]
MSKLRGGGKLIQTDVLVIGGGIAGLWAASRAKASADRVLVVDKGPRDWGGLASLAGGDMIVVFPEDNIHGFMDDLVYYYEGLCEQDLVQEIFSKTFDRFEDYERLGHRFARTDEGKLKGVPQRGLRNIKLYLSRPFGEGGINMVRAVVGEVERLGVQRLGRIMITDLLKEGDAVAGAVGFDTISGEFHTIKAGAVILTTGVSGWKTSYGKSTTTGEGIFMAMRAGVDVRNFEFMKVWNVPRHFGWEGQTSLLPLGA